jgi:hypothetical protein
LLGQSAFQIAGSKDNRKVGKIFAHLFTKSKKKAKSAIFFHYVGDGRTHVINYAIWR